MRTRPIERQWLRAPAPIVCDQCGRTIAANEPVCLITFPWIAYALHGCDVCAGFPAEAPVVIVAGQARVS